MREENHREFADRNGKPCFIRRMGSGGGKHEHVIAGADHPERPFTSHVKSVHDFSEEQLREQLLEGR